MFWVDTNRQLSDFFTDGALPSVMSVDKRHYDEKEYEFFMHGHNNICEITFIFNGNGLYHQGKDAYLVHKGDICLYNQGETHLTEALTDEGVSYYTIGLMDLRKKGLPLNWLRREEDPCILHSGKMYPVLASIAEQLYIMLGNQIRHRSRDLSVQLLGAALIVMLEQLQPESSHGVGNLHPAKGIPGSDRETPIKSYLDQHYTENLTLSFVASELGYSETYVSHEFKKRYGESPMQYVMRLRISQAQLLLHSTNLKVSEVGRKVGYDNTSYFITLFTRQVGMTPVKYRQLVIQDVHRYR